MIRKVPVKTPVTVMPNPANDYVLVSFFANRSSDISIRLTDNSGKTVLLQNQKVTIGNATIQVNGLSKYSPGVYSIQVLVNGDIISKKVIITR